jgi:hypothetical protein
MLILHVLSALLISVTAAQSVMTNAKQVFIQRHIKSNTVRYATSRHITTPTQTSVSLVKTGHERTDNMYFVKEATNILWPYLQPHRQFYYYVECSKGCAFIRKLHSVGSEYGWQVTIWDAAKTKGMTRSQKNMVSPTRSGRSPTLYKAAVAVLQRLFTQRRCRLYKLMAMLESDQVLYELGRIGEP